jgi:hypothetical protein
MLRTPIDSILLQLQQNAVIAKSLIKLGAFKIQAAIDHEMTWVFGNQNDVAPATRN